MNIAILMIPIALCLAFGFLAAFVISANAGQYDDLDTPPQKILLDESLEREPER